MRMEVRKAVRAQSDGWKAWNDAHRAFSEGADNAWEVWVRAWEAAIQQNDQSAWQAAQAAQAKLVTAKKRVATAPWEAWAKAWEKVWEAGPNPTEETP